MREITDHKTSAANGELTVTVEDEAGSGGANHLYMIRGYDSTTNKSDPFVARYGKGSDHSTILFQNGPIKEAGVNGLTHEVLLAIVIDRLACFQKGTYANAYNAKALDHCEAALANLKARTTERQRRGVEGTHQQ